MSCVRSRSVLQLLRALAGRSAARVAHKLGARKFCVQEEFLFLEWTDSSSSRVARLARALERFRASRELPLGSLGLVGGRAGRGSGSLCFCPSNSI